MIQVVILIRSYPCFFTCESTLAGVSGGQRLDVVRGVGDLISSILDGDGVGAGGVGDVGHSVGSVPVVLDGSLLRFALWVLSVFEYGERES